MAIWAVMVSLAADWLEQGMKIVLVTRGVVFPVVLDRENATLVCFLLLRIPTKLCIGDIE